MRQNFLEIKEKEKERGKKRMHAYGKKGDGEGWEVSAGGRKREQICFKQQDKREDEEGKKRQRRTERTLFSIC